MSAAVDAYFRAMENAGPEERARITARAREELTPRERAEALAVSIRDQDRRGWAVGLFLSD